MDRWVNSCYARIIVSGKAFHCAFKPQGVLGLRFTVSPEPFLGLRSQNVRVKLRAKRWRVSLPPKSDSPRPLSVDQFFTLNFAQGP